MEKVNEEMKEMKEILTNVPKSKTTTSIPSSRIGTTTSKIAPPARPGTSLGTSSKAASTSFGLKRPSTAVTSTIKKK